MRNTPNSKKNGNTLRNNIQIRERYYEQRFGPMLDMVAHSTDEQPVHIDIYVFKPSAERAHWTLVTSGMSDLPMTLPTSAKDIVAPRAELVMYTNHPKQWMFKALKAMAEFASRNNTYLFWRHTWTRDAPLTDTAPQLTSCLILPPYLEDSSMNNLRLEGDKVEFLWVVPITERERTHAVQNGSHILEKALMTSGLDLLDYEGRDSVV